MNTSRLTLCCTALAASSLLLSSAQAATYSGNGATGFGGSVGTGSLSISDTASSLTFTFNRGSGSMDNDLVIYLNTQPGGFADTSLFDDNGDGGRTAISGANNGNPSRSLLSFPTGFGADYAISIENGYIGVFQLAAGGNNSFTWLFGQGQSGDSMAASYSLTLNAAQMAQIGLTPDSGQSFDFVGSLISTSAYRANETIGSSSSDAAGNAGFNDPQSFSASLQYTLVPEPSSLALLGLGCVLGCGWWRRRP